MKYLILLIVALLPFSAHAEGRPLVLELFTSQGCSACPPADKVMSELIEDNPDMLMLSFHVDYWDRLGWKDPYSLPAATDRQKAYANTVAAKKIFTPQAMINGEWSFIGTKHGDISDALDEARDDESPYLPVTLAQTPTGLEIKITPEADNAVRGTASIWLIGYSGATTNRIGRGENRGIEVINHNNVQQLMYLGEWHENAVALTLDFVPEADFAAVIVQRPASKILGAASVALQQSAPSPDKE